MKTVSELENLCGPGKPLRSEPADPQETAHLITSGKLRLRDAKNASLALESRFDLVVPEEFTISRTRPVLMPPPAP